MEAKLQAFLTSPLMDASGHLNALAALPPGKEQTVPTGKENRHDDPESV